MDPEHQQILKENYSLLVSKIEYNDKLIKYLRQYKIFNRYMWKDIDSISDVLDLLPTRGPKAFTNFIEILRNNGYDSEADHLEKKSLSIKKSNKLYYTMSSKPLGYCLIINNMEFDHPDLEYREGSDVDANSLKGFFEKADFKVEKKENLYSHQMKNCLLEFSKRNFTSVDSMILIIMSHGELSHDNREILYGKEGGILHKDEIYEMFSNKNCESLQSKPKVFIFIACRGKIKDYGVEKTKKKESLDSSSITRNKVDTKILPQLSDMLIINSSLPKNQTARHHEKGTYFCQALVSVLEENYKTEDLETMIKLVNQELEGKVSEEYRITLAVHAEITDWKKKLMLCRRN